MILKIVIITISKKIMKIIFQLWHKRSCIKNKHKFFITMYQNHILFYCKDCHIEEFLLK